MLCTVCAVVAVVVLLVVVYNLWKWQQSRLNLSSLHNRHVFVTGCDTGFGRRLAMRLDKMGVPVFAACLTSSAMQELSSQATERLTPVLMDVTKDDDIERALREVKAKLPEGKGETVSNFINSVHIIGT
jgi:NAD(P)-dependent dehydrogenase (short-subunit alcohol dehydrogenase family)